MTVLSGTDLIQRAEILGFSIVGAGPVGAVHLPANEGLTVLYGQNGAGKTTVLNGIQAALSGLASDEGRAFLHIQVGDDYYDEDVETLGTVIGLELTKRLTEELERRTLQDGSTASLMDDALSPHRFAPLMAATCPVLLREDPHILGSPGAIARSMGNGRTISLESVGQSTPSWNMFLGLPPSGSAEVESLRTLLEGATGTLEIFYSHNASEVVSLLEEGNRQGNLSEWVDAYDEDTIKLIELLRQLNYPPSITSALDEVRIADIHTMLATASDGSHEVTSAQFDLADLERRFAQDVWREKVERLRDRAAGMIFEATVDRLPLHHAALDLTSHALETYAAFSSLSTPGWTPFPLLRLPGSMTSLPLPRLVVEPGVEIAARIAAAIPRFKGVAERVENHAKDGEDGERFAGPRDNYEEAFSWMDKAVAEVSRPIQREANTFLAAAFTQPPIVRAAETSVMESLQGDWIRWESFDTPTNEWIPVERTSSAQQRWIGLALAHATSGLGGRRFVIIDEPEQAMHRGAIARLATSLPSIASNTDTTIVVATHAPEFITAPNADVFHIQRQEPSGRASAVELTSRDRSDITSASADLGVSPADLLQMTRTFVLTETFGNTRSISTVAGSATGFVAAGPIFADSGPVTIWTSPDGTRWQAVASFKAGYVLSVIEAGPAMAAAGGVQELLGGTWVSRAAVWVGPPGT